MFYRRDIFEKGFAKIKNEFYRETGNYHTDTYTGKPLKPGETWDFEHVISAKEFSGLPNVNLLEAQAQSNILNNRKNIGFTMKVINKSKSKYSLVEWQERESNGRTINNATHYGIDIDNAKKLRRDVLEILMFEINKEVVNL